MHLILTGLMGLLLGWVAFPAIFVGLLLQAIEKRVGQIGRIVVGLLGVSWTAASFLVVPVLVTRDVGPVDAVKESVLLLKKTWAWAQFLPWSILPCLRSWPSSQFLSRCWAR